MDKPATMLEVYLEPFDRPVGLLRQAGKTPGEIEFTYDPDYLQRADKIQLSLRLPLREQPYDDVVARPYFENLLPEGRRRDQEAARAGTTANDVIGILGLIGKDCAGAVSLVRPGERPVKRPALLPDDYDPLDEETLIQSLRRLEQGMPADQKEKPSLAGVQGKIAVAMDRNGAFYMPCNGAATTHLIKVSDRQFPNGVDNEYFCLSLLKRLGIPTVNFQKRRFMAADGTQLDALIVDRYDRKIVSQGNGLEVSRLHQEDFCQALGCTSYAKYEHRGGPTLQRIFEVAEHTAVPASTRQTLLEALIANLLCGNSDAHAKNFSLVYQQGSKYPSLAPIYDILCVKLYPDYNHDMAQKIGGTANPDEIAKADLEAFAKETTIGWKLLAKTVNKLVSKATPIAITLSREIDVSRFHASRILGVIDARSRHLADIMGISYPDYGIDAFVERSPGWQMLS
ncbi:type II toxin-antitoxin system HipA family toxin [uncultured Ferrovibrio sp.]|mgnify:FL=1|jgi:HipA N-terminal domain|uniref:type II toxin-antitoxin system HipA family toxin n=1 Tax=uncultured Ferrovibrio sp. TaxID=1576913 RepID=UPI00262BDFA8|nr:type II toxin-antitoxin system HipA family toxin [uncultured Ferrovibrio sp.]